MGNIIPETNIKDLVLKDEVVEAVKKGNFHIYAISKLEEGMELLMQMPAGKNNKNGKYPSDSIHGKVMKKLKAYYKGTSGEK